MPAQVGGDDVAVSGGGDGGEPGGGPALVGGQEPVPGRESTMGDEQLAEVFAADAGGELVDAVVGEGHAAGGDDADAVGDVGFGQPRQTVAGRVVGGERVDESGEGRVDGAGAVVEEPLDPCGEGAAATAAGAVEVVDGPAVPAAQVGAVDASAGSADRCAIGVDAGQGPALVASWTGGEAAQPGPGTGRAETAFGPGWALRAPAARLAALGSHWSGLVIWARRGRRPDGFFFAAVVLAVPVAAEVTIRSVGVQSKMSHNAARMCNDSRSGRPATSR